MNVIPIRGKHENWQALLLEVQQSWPKAKSGVVIVFDEAGDMHTHFKGTSQQLALAGARLLHLANLD